MQPLFLTIFCALSFHVFAFSNPWENQNFFVAPITTELQRAEISSSADVFAAINCDVISLDGLDLSKLNPDELRKELGRYAGEGKTLRLILRYQSPTKHSKKAQQKIKSQLTELAKDSGYRVKSSERQTSGEWDEQLGVAMSFAQDSDATENVVETPLVRAYPITTRLSKFELGRADCVVTIIRPVDGRFKDGLPKELTQSISSVVKQMDLPQKKWLGFNITSTTAGRELVDQLFSARPPPQPPAKPNPLFLQRLAAYKMSPAFQLALDLGFERMQYKHSTQGGSPELRVGEKAPNFQATDLNGQSVEFTSFRNARPTLLTFWGVACGPCRAEAPHLTRLHEKYSDDFAILAVSDYKESRDKVLKYVEKEKLTHRIVLPKGKVSQKYGVASHPTTFWIDKDGVVRDFVIGFHSSEDLEKRIQDMLTEQ